MTMENNTFLNMRCHIEKMVGNYKTALKDFTENHKTNDEWHSKTIYRMAQPYLHGCFTLAIIGEMSSGKSTFINTLIGKNILPTGHFQTTSAITYIEHGVKESMKVVYADGHEQTFEAQHIKSALHELVAIPEEYNDLPISEINLLISGGDKLSDILAKKEGIEKKSHVKSDVALWKKYIQSHPKSSIASKVYIYYPLSEELQGWRIVDTPGVGAIGGIQEETKRFLASRDENGNKLFDAIIFLKKGSSNIESDKDKEFFDNVVSQLTDEAKKRLFFIITHATDKDFRLYRNDILEKAQRYYGRECQIPSSRMICVDSLMAKFRDDIRNQGIFATDIEDMDEPLEGWSSEEYEKMAELYRPLKKELKSRNLAYNNENLLSLMEEWGNFVTLKKIINDFAMQTKGKSFLKIKSLIQEDYNWMIKKYKKDIHILREGGQEAINKERASRKESNIEYNKILNKLRQASAITPILDKFKFVDDGLRTLSQKKSIDEVRTTYQNIMDRAIQVEHDIFEHLKNDFKSYCDDYAPNDITLKQIDFEALEHKAEEESIRLEPIYKDVVNKGGFSAKKTTTKVLVRTDKVIDEEQMKRNFIAYVLKQAPSIIQSFKVQLQEKVERLCHAIKEDIRKKEETEEEHLKILETKIQGACKDDVATINKEIDKITNYLEILSHGNNE